MAGRTSSAVFSHPALWRGNACARVAVASVPTGFAELDVLLPGAGWPAEALTEFHVEHPGIGELKLVMPALARLSAGERWVAFVAPPRIPYPPALAAHGLRLSHAMLIRAAGAEMQIWAAEQALRSGSCGATLLWFDRAPEPALRRLQRAAEGSGALIMLFRGPRAASFSCAALRIHLGKSDGRTIARILKRRGGGVPAPVALDLHRTIERPARCSTAAFDSGDLRAAH
ncbi:MAG TPA: translesion DNA synthesis-associated protein ImuA [Burkholderiales bacterium]|nr:translesion DNA synthesis-associated protein ImuA [Burkholderiales bacterium]